MPASPTRFVAVVVGLLALAPACARRPRPGKGTTERRLSVGGVTRTYLLHAGGQAQDTGAAAPNADAAANERTLVLVLHGRGGSGAGIEWRTNGTFDRLADRDGAVVIYPQALGDPHRWNEGGGGFSDAAPDDLAFLAALIDTAVTELGVDRRRVFAAGLSDGACMVYRLACERPDLVAAVAPVAGGMVPAVASACVRGAPVSIIAMHGSADPIAPDEQPIRDGIAEWARRDGCPAVPTSSQLPDLDPDDGTRTRVDLFAPCMGGTAVTFYEIEGGGHAWPGGPTPRDLRRRGNTPRDFDAGVAIWNFFGEHARQ
jgi:polyhydroxybutyrate depolymerase